MGYCMSQNGSKFYIAQADQAAALATALELCNHPEKMSAGWFDQITKVWSSFSWVDIDEFRAAKTLVEALKAWRWIIEVDVDDNVIAILFDGEKLGQDQLLFDAIAPWVQDGSYIEMSGEDGSMWRWVFEAGKCHEVQATITW